jgi:hypothetical protein
VTVKERKYARFLVVIGSIKGPLVPKNHLQLPVLVAEAAARRPTLPWEAGIKCLGATMQTTDVQVPDSGGPALPLLAAADLQDHLMVASNDLERLQRLLDDASETLSGHFYCASSQLSDVLRALTQQPDIDQGQMHEAMQNLANAITALQFHDMATQLICHTQKRLRSCADRIARDAMGDEDEDGSAVVADGPGRPNPVTQDEMDAGSIDLF